jgi:hypothetical protein
MADRDTKLKVLQTSTYNTTQFGCKSNIIMNHCFTPTTNYYTKLMRIEMFRKSILKLNNQSANN